MIGFIRCVVLFNLSLSVVRADYLATQIFMNPKSAENRFGATSFSYKNFKNGTPAERGSMAISALKEKRLLGKSAKEIKSELGDFDGFFFSDSVPAYILQELNPIPGETWQLVFLLDDLGQVKDIKIHKNCCAPSKE